MFILNQDLGGIQMKQKNMLADFLKQKRIAAGLSQRDVADKLGYSTPQFISNWERGVSHPPINALKRLGDLYKVSAEDLFEVTLNATIQEVTQDLRKKFATSKAR
ncbi:MAG TPA: helix-turn-helix transcriptional regulator [Bdellovibrio sp.]|uniref:helix-turn-helix domain-containing protein n=1 Tax=Bdellovibrio sp. TaxID=28201 RepID=UPI002EF4C019